jgi:glycine cleavage system H protein
MNIPANLHYTKDHEWIKVEENNIAVVGITEHAQKELGDIVYVEIESIGESLDQNAVFGTVEAVKTVADLFLPVAGKVLEVNADLSGEPALVNSSPYEKGWLIRLELANTEDLQALLTAEGYKELIHA